MKITLVTGSQHKLREWRRLLPAEIELDHVYYDLPEIQSNDLVEIATAKAKAAYALAKRPVLVEDTSVGLDKLKGLPGPFIKFFEEKLGDDALYQLAGNQHASCKATSLFVLYDGATVHTFVGETTGTTVDARGTNGFGFDKVFRPDGSDITYAQMTPEQKDSFSHRGKAMAELIKHLKSAT